MKLEKRDVAECLGLTYDGEESDTYGDYYHTFYFRGKMIQDTTICYSAEEAWEEAANKVLEPFVELLKSKLTA